MNTKIFFSLLVIVLFIAACAPVVTVNETPTDLAKQTTIAKPTTQETDPVIPVTGASVAVPNRDAQEPILWSGEIFNSDGNSPDRKQIVRAPGVITIIESACSSEDALIQRFGGCIE